MKDKNPSLGTTYTYIGKLFWVIGTIGSAYEFIKCLLNQNQINYYLKVLVVFLFSIGFGLLFYLKGKDLNNNSNKKNNFLQISTNPLVYNISA